MPHFFKKEENLPFRYPAIQAHKRKTNSSGWIIGLFLVAVLLIGAYLLFT